MSRLARVLIFTAAAFALPAAAQTAAPDTSNTASQIAPGAKPAAQPGTGKGGVRISQPISSNLTANECRKLGGKTEIDDGGSCRYRMRCTIIHANGDVNSSCIDELE